MSESDTNEVKAIKAVLEKMRASELQWKKEQSEENKINHPSAQSKIQTSKDTDS